MSDELGHLSDLRPRREARGVSIDDAARATRIPVAHLHAIEEGRIGDLPEGPYAPGQIRAYFNFLGLEPAPGVLDGLGQPLPGATVDARQVWAVRLVAGAVCAVLAVLLVALLAPDLQSPSPQDTTLDPRAPDQRVAVTALRTTRVAILVDGEQVLDREVPGGESVQVAGHHRVEVRLHAAQDARVEYNGGRIEPQGRQDVPRRLVFIDDLDRAGP